MGKMVFVCVWQSQAHKWLFTRHPHTSIHSTLSLYILYRYFSSVFFCIFFFLFLSFYLPFGHLNIYEVNLSIDLVNVLSLDCSGCILTIPMNRMNSFKFSSFLLFFSLSYYKIALNTPKINAIHNEKHANKFDIFTVVFFFSFVLFSFMFYFICVLCMWIIFYFDKFCVLIDLVDYANVWVLLYNS